jgi:hypothetical protein
MPQKTSADRGITPFSPLTVLVCPLRKVCSYVSGLMPKNTVNGFLHLALILLLGYGYLFHQ